MEHRHATLTGAGLAITFSNVERPGPAEHILTGLDGWYGGVSVEGESTPRPLGHGAFPLTARRGPRALTLRATMVHDSEASRTVTDRVLSGVLWDGEYGSLTVNVGGLELTADVRLDGDIRHAYLGGHASTVEIPLLAPDPFLVGPPASYRVYPGGIGEGLEFNAFADAGILTYGDSVPTSKVLIRNAGNAQAWPLVVVTGDFPGGFALTAEGRTVAFNAPTWKASPVLVDMAGGSVTVNGSDQTFACTRREWWSIPARGAVQPRITALTPGTGSAEVIARDTYI